MKKEGKNGKKTTNGKKKPTKPGKAPAKKDRIRVGLTRPELMTAVCHQHCKGLSASEIAATLNDEFPGLALSREEPYAIVRDAAKRGWLTYRPPQKVQFEQSIGERYPWLKSVRVAHTTIVADVAKYTAKELLRIVRALYHDGKTKKVRIGLAGGHSLRCLAQELAVQLCEPVNGLPDEIWFHALATGFDPEDPTTDPNAFVTFFQHFEPVLQVKACFRGLSAPSMVPPAEIAPLRELEDIANAFNAVEELDIIVTSGTRWNDKHGALHRRMRDAGADTILNEEECIGDVLWRPIAKSGPIVAETELRAMTLVELTDLPRLIKESKTRVMLMLAPCGRCHAPKGELLDTVLNLDPSQQIVTDVVVDSVTAGQMLRLGHEAA